MSDTRKLALELHEIRQLALGHATNPQFGNSSVDGEGLSFRDGDGNEIGRIGGGDNGLEVAYTYGPKPLMPSAPIVTADANLLRVQWDGQWADGNEDGDAVADPDLASQSGLDRVEVHASMDPAFVPDPILSFAGVLPVTDEGGAHTVGPLAEAGDYYVVLMARGKDGQYSAPSQRVHVVTTVGLMENELFDLALRADEARESADGKNTVHYGEEPTPPDGGFSEGDLWFDTVEDPETGVRKNTPHLWDPTANGGEGGWVSAADSRVDAVQDAVADLESALDDIVVDGSGTQNFYQTEPPKLTDDPAPAEGDLWFDQNDQNKPYIFRDSDWVSIRDDSFLSTAKDLTPWSAHVPNPHAMAGQVAEMDVIFEVGEDAIPIMPGALWARLKTNASHHEDRLSTALVRLPFQGGYASAASDEMTFDETAHPFEGRTVSSHVTVGAVYPEGNLPATRVYLNVSLFDIEGNPAGSRRLSARFERVAAGSVLETYGFTHGVDQAIEVGVTEAMYPTARYMTIGIEFSIPRKDGVTITLLSAPTHVQISGDAIGAGAITEAKLAAEAVTETKIAPDSISSPKIVAGAIQTSHLVAEAVTAEKMAVGTITADSGIIGSLNAGVITAGTLNSARLAADSITADKLLIGGAMNLIPGYMPGSNKGFSTLVEDALEKALRADGRGTHYADESFQLPPGEYVVEADIKASVTGTRTYIGVLGLDDTPVLYRYGISDVQVGTAWQKFTAPLSIGEGDQGTFRLRLLPAYSGDTSATTWYRNISLRPLVGATLIENGAITTEKIATGAITAESGIIGSLDAGVITTGELRGELIRAQSIAGESLAVDAIDGKTITGATVRTSATGARVELGADGLRQYNAFNQPIVEMVNGDVTVVGALYSGPAGGSRVQIDSAIYAAPEEIPEGAMPDPGGIGAGIRLGRDKTSGVDLYYGLAQRNTSELLNTFMVDAPIGAGKAKLYMSDAGAVTISGENDSGPDSNKTQFIMTNDQYNSTSTVFRGAPEVTLASSRNGLNLSRLSLGSDRNGAARGAVDLQTFGHAAPSGSNYASLSLTAPTATGQGTFGLSALGAGGSSYVRANTSAVEMRSHIGSALIMHHSGSSSGRVILSAQGSLSLRSIGGNVDVNGSQVTLNASGQVTLGTTRVFWEDIPNAHNGTEVSILSNGSIGKTGSSRRYKIAEEPLERTQPDFYERLLEVQPKTWYDKAEAEYHADVAHSRTLGVGIDPDGISDGELRRSVGAIAEDLDEAGLGLLVSYNGDGSPESIMYSRVGIALIPVVRSLRDRVNELERMMGEMANA